VTAVCAAVLDNWFGIDRPTIKTPDPVAMLPPQIANPNAGEAQADLSPSVDISKSKRRGAASLRIDRATSTGNAGLNIPA
jgi:hypothetical protein